MSALRELVAEIEARAAKAKADTKHPDRYDYERILASVAAENDVVEGDLRVACLDVWAGPGGTL